MTIEQAVYEVLAADAGLVAACPEILPSGDWQNKPLPYICHFSVISQSIFTHDALQALEFHEYYQISVFASSQLEARTIADLVRTALHGTHVLNVSPEDGMTCLYDGERTLPYDFEVRAAHIALNFRIAFPRS